MYRLVISILRNCVVRLEVERKCFPWHCALTKTKRIPPSNIFELLSNPIDKQ